VKAQRLEGLIAKRCDSKYEAGLRSGGWLKMRVNVGQEFVIGGYTPSLKNLDALVIGYYDGPKLIYAARTRNGFTPASRAQLFKKLKPLETNECPREQRGIIRFITAGLRDGTRRFGFRFAWG
jgi:ATP-dependent DNA ligase